MAEQEEVIDELYWEKAKKHLEDTAAQYKKIPFESAWFVMGQLGKLKIRIEQGERTRQLYDEIISME